MVRATNWLGDAVMSLPAIRAIRGVFPQAHLAVVASRGWPICMRGKSPSTA